MSRRISAGSTSRMRMFVPPKKNPETPQPLPAMWNSGMATRLTESASNDQTSPAAGSISKKFRLTSSTPLGRPVVPEVYSW